MIRCLPAHPAHAVGALQRWIKLAAKNREETATVEFKSNSKINEENVMNPTAGHARTTHSSVFVFERVRISADVLGCWALPLPLNMAIWFLFYQLPSSTVSALANIYLQQKSAATYGQHSGFHLCYALARSALTLKLYTHFPWIPLFLTDHLPSAWLRWCVYLNQPAIQEVIKVVHNLFVKQFSTYHQHTLRVPFPTALAII